MPKTTLCYSLRRYQVNTFHGGGKMGGLSNGSKQVGLKQVIFSTGQNGMGWVDLQTLCCLFFLS